jgi:hypothetical protein
MVNNFINSGGIISNDTISVFAKSSRTEILPTLIINNQYHYLGLVLLVLILFIAAIWYYLPEVLNDNFNSLINNPFKRNWESSVNTSGLVVNALLYVNFVLVFSFLVLIVINSIFPDYLSLKMSLFSLYPISLITVIFLIFRFLFVKLSGFIFKTFEMANQQNRLYNSLDRGLGLILLPLLLFSIYGDNEIFLFLSVLVLAIFFVLRWIFTILIGIRITKFSWFHIIVYLCTLEIIPFLILLKALNNEVFKVL